MEDATMATAKDFQSQNTGWLHDLARAEVHPEAERLLGLGGGLDPHQLAEESTIQFLMELREKFTEHSRVFNSYSEAGGRFQEVKIFSVAQTPADFMVFRNQIKLVISNSAHGVVTIAFANHNRSAFSFDGHNPDQGQAQLPSGQELLANVGPFRDIQWMFQGQEINPDKVAKFYFAEFIRSTREKKASKGQNQMLLEQIRTLLQDKGLDF